MINRERISSVLEIKPFNTPPHRVISLSKLAWKKKHKTQQDEKKSKLTVRRCDIELAANLCTQKGGILRGAGVTHW